MAEQVTVLAALAGLVWWSAAVWTGRARAWFYTEAGWHTHGGGWVFWPGPIGLVLMVAVAALVLPAAEVVEARSGFSVPLGPLVTVIVGGPLLAVLFPARWMFPPWVHRRITPLPDPSQDHDRRFVALHSRGGPYGGGSSGWLFGFDAVAGHVTLDGSTLRFEASGPVPELPLVEKHRHYSVMALRPLKSRSIELDDIVEVASLPWLLPARRRQGALEVRTRSSVSTWLVVADQRAAVASIRAAASGR